MPSSEEYRPDVALLTGLLHDPSIRHEHSDIIHSLLWCRAEEVEVVQEALIDRVVGEHDEDLADTIGQALGALWAEHGPPDLRTLDRLSGVARRLAIATLVALRPEDTSWIANLDSKAT